LAGSSLPKGLSEATDQQLAHVGRYHLIHDRLQLSISHEPTGPAQFLAPGIRRWFRQRLQASRCWTWSATPRGLGRARARVRTLRVPACVRVRVPRVLGSDDVSENSGHAVRVGAHNWQNSAPVRDGPQPNPLWGEGPRRPGMPNLGECSVCGGPMWIVEPGQRTHPNCDPGETDQRARR
jgi:hypothetical protein